MQYSTISYLKKAAVSKNLFLAVKGIVLGLMLYFIHLKISQGQLTPVTVTLFAQGLWERHPWYLLLFPGLLVFLNWGLEGKKWQLLAGPVIYLTLRQATRAVLTGLSLGFITPRSLGDYAGRLLEADSSQRSRLVGAVLLNRVSQSVCTYFFGLLGFAYLLLTTSFGHQLPWPLVYALLVAGLSGSLLLLGGGRRWLLEQGRRRFSHRYLQFVEVIGEYRKKDIYRLVMFAGLRYTVFTLQFVWILRLAGVPLPLPALFGGVAVVFVLKSVIPAFNFLSDLGVREFSALWVFAAFAVPESPVLLGSLLLWCLNILLPTLAGTYNVVCFRLSRL